MQGTVVEKQVHREKVIQTTGPAESEAVATLQRRVDELVRENEELMKKTQVVVKKVETNIVERKAGLDEETVQHISDLERRLSQAELLSTQKIKEVEVLQTQVVEFRDLRSEFDVLKNKNHHLEQQWTDKVKEFEAFELKYNHLNELYLQDKDLLANKEKELLELHRRLKELEPLPNQIAAATKNSQLLGAEVDRLTLLAQERDTELDSLRKKFKDLEAQRCVNPREHEDLRVRITQITNLEGEHNDLKDKYSALCTEYDREIAIVRNKDKEIQAINKQLEQNIKESQKALNRELSKEEKLQHEIDALTAALTEKERQVIELKRQAEVIPGLQKRIQTLESEYRAFEERYRRLEEVNSQLNAKSNGLLAELENLRDLLKNKEKAFVALEKEKAALVAEFEKSQKESSAMLARLTENKNLEIEALNNKVAALGKQLNDMNKDIEALRTECDRLNAEKARLAKVLEEHIAQEKDLFAKVEKLKKEREALASDIAELAAQRDNLKGVVKAKDQEVHVLDKDVNNLNKETSHLHEKINDLESRLASLTNLLREREAEIVSLKDTLKNVNNAHSELVKERETLVVENASLVQKVTELESSVTVITTKYTKLEKIYNEIKAATAHLGAVHDQLIETCEETEKISHADATTVTHQKVSVKEKIVKH